MTVDKPHIITPTDRIFTGREAFINASTPCPIAAIAIRKTKNRINIPVRTRGTAINIITMVSSKRKNPRKDYADRGL